MTERGGPIANRPQDTILPHRIEDVVVQGSIQREVHGETHEF
jgi:hypothetical protein